ncbi:uncharacterized protein LOC118281138 [Spodoptera frugiperda]|uniref:Uncharacterized protein LOC118281138 n=1 Tax=Spodoptera frugiperda TaxID=7108 RepID=A0A9R0E1C3_SPOFR|nr:uncharacterized protein LOC118281138 [Spodoptera frugiperda]
MDSPMLFCISCLSREVPYIRLSTCSHADFLNSFGELKIESSNQVVCYTCHNVLKKIKLFTLQVKNSFNIISEESNIQISPQQNRNLRIHRQENINIPQTSVPIDINQTIDSKEVTNDTEMSFKRKNYDRKIKNIGKALKIINSNQNNACINLLATSLNSLSSSLINKNVDFNNFPILNAINKVSQSVGHISEATDTSNILQEAMVKGNLEANFGIREEELSLDKKEKDIEVPSKIRKMDKPNKNVLKSSIQSRINTIRLSKEELMAERSKLASSQPYLKAPYKCDTCVLGFNYEENLEDHIKRKHCYKEISIKCDVCQQYFNPGSNYNDHIAYHYTRYECTICGRRFPSEDQAIFHYRRNHIKATKYSCLHCSYNMTSYRHIKLASAVKQTNKCKIYKCLRCKKTWKNVEQNLVENVLEADGATVE